MRMYTFILSTGIFCLFLGVGCASLETRLQDHDAEGHAEKAFFLAVEEYDDEPHNPEYQKFVREYAPKAFEAQMRRADFYRRRNEWTNLMHALYEGPTSALAIIDAARARGVNINGRNQIEAGRAADMRALDLYYREGVELYDRGEYDRALDHFTKMRGLKNADSFIASSDNEVEYAEALSYFDAGDFRRAYKEFGDVDSGFRDAEVLREEARERGTTVIAVVGFHRNDERKVRDEIVRVLSCEPWVRVVDSRYAPGVLYVVDGGVETEVTPGKTRKYITSGAWYFTGEVEEVGEYYGKPQYAFVAVPLTYHSVTKFIEVCVDIHFHVNNAYTREIIPVKPLGASAVDTVAYCYSDEYNDREWYTVQDPSSQKYNGAKPDPDVWRMSSKDRAFQKRFHSPRKLATAKKLRQDLIKDLKKKAARAVTDELREQIRYDYAHGVRAKTR